jgi:hypothetical protein
MDDQFRIFFVLLVVGVFLGLAAMVVRYAQRAWPILCAVAAWLAMTGALGVGGFFADFASFPPRMPLFVIVQFAGLVWLIFYSPWRKALLAIPQSWLVGFQTFRIGVELALSSLALHWVLPLEMSYHGRNFDILTGLSAPVAVYCLRRYGAGRWLVAWNLAGLALVTWVVAHGLLSAPYPMQMLHFTVDNAGIAEFPVCWLPFFLVPVAYALHFISLRSLLRSLK